MKIDVSKLKPTQASSFKEMMEISEDTFKCVFPLLGVKSVEVEATAHSYEDFVDISYKINALVTLQCSYTLKPFDYRVHASDELQFASYKEEDSDLIEFKGNFIDLTPYVLNLLSASIPTSPKSPGAKLPSGGKGYRVLTEEELVKEKEEKGDSRFDKLLDLEFDE